LLSVTKFILHAKSKIYSTFIRFNINGLLAIFREKFTLNLQNKKQLMKLTTRGHYSVKALLDISLQPERQPTPVKAIAHRQDLPAPYLEKLLIEMRRAGLVKSVRGSQGGYQLARKPSQISLGQILEAVGETIEPLPRHHSNVEQAEDWVTFSLWKRLHQKMKEALYNITLADLYYDARSWQAAQGEETSFVV
jgi:Rrf2 family transcriptional regulator, iron-sulfur cluster assembly transcription factor